MTTDKLFRHQLLRYYQRNGVKPSLYFSFSRSAETCSNIICRRKRSAAFLQGLMHPIYKTKKPADSTPLTLNSSSVPQFPNTQKNIGTSGWGAWDCLEMVHLILYEPLFQCSSSPSVSLTCGVPQGSILGP